MKNLCQLLGLPSEEQLPESEAIRDLWLQQLESEVERMNRAGVVISLEAWAGFTPLERELVARYSTPNESWSDTLEEEVFKALEILKDERLAGDTTTQEHAGVGNLA